MKATSLIFTAVLALASVGASAQYNQGPPPNQNQNQGQYGRGPGGGQYQGGGDPWAYDNGRPGNYGPDWDRRPDPRRGACFFTDANFSGHRFCVRAGDRLAFLPAGYGHSISSVRTFGGARVTAFARRDFQGQRADFRDAPDLGYSSRGPYRGWNDRISSVIVQ